MFSYNGRISEKQMRSMLILYIFMSVMFVLPHLFSYMFGKDIIAGVIVFYLLSAVYVGVVMLAGRCIGGHTTFLLLITVIRYMARLVFCILLTVAVLSEGKVPFMEKEGVNSFVNLAVLLPLLLVAFYGAGKGVEKQGRISEMLMPAAILPYIIMIFFGIGECDFSCGLNIFPKEISLGKMLFEDYALLTFIAPIEIYLWLKSRSAEEEVSDIKTYMSVMGILLSACVICILMAGIYGVNGMAGDSMASVSIMRYIELPLGVLRRFDVLMVWFFMTGCFVLLCNTMFYIRQGLRYRLNEKKAYVTLGLLLATALVFAYFCPGYEDMVKVYTVYGAVLEIPLSLLTILIAGYGSKVKNVVAVFVCLIISTAVTGCSPDIENIEQRDYVTVLMIAPEEAEETQYMVGIAKEHKKGEEYEAESVFVSSAKDIDDLSAIYGERKGKDLSFSHLKVILIASDNGQTGDELMDLNANSEVAKTCPVLMVEDKERTIEYIKRAKIPVATYINNLIDVRKRSNKKVTKLMDYLKSIREGTKVDMLFLAFRDEDLIIE